MSVKINGQQKRLGLALSGGGFRAAAFHLGVFHKLKELGLLYKIDLLTCVSGGSIAGAHLAMQWEQEDALDKLEDYLSTRSIAVSTVLGGLLDPFETRLDKLAKSYDRHLFNGAMLDDLKAGPRIYFNSTNLATGNMFFLVAGGNKDSEIGEWELGVQPAGSFMVSDAVAASSAFPPVFPPLRLDQDKYPNDAVDYVTLTDGGIYDNLGVNPLLRQSRNQLDFCLVSDGGKPFAINSDPAASGLAVLKETIGILMEQVRGLQFSKLELAHLAKRGPKPIWFSLDSIEGEENPGDATFSSLIGTNLTRLSDQELSVLKRHGGALIESRIRKYSPELIS